jgi:hypothetical protein
MKEIRPSMTEGPDALKGPEIFAAVGAKWKTLSADDRKPYDAKAVQNKAAYTIAMEKYTKEGGSNTQQHLHKFL